MNFLRSLSFKKEPQAGSSNTSSDPNGAPNDVETEYTSSFLEASKNPYSSKTTNPKSKNKPKEKRNKLPSEERTSKSLRQEDHEAGGTGEMKGNGGNGAGWGEKELSKRAAKKKMKRENEEEAKRAKIMGNGWGLRRGNT